MKNKYIAAGLAILFGMIGVHKFYLGNTQGGIIYIIILFMGAVFPLLVLFILIYSFCEGVNYLSMSDEKFQSKYSSGIKCPFCCEIVNKDAKLCRHCKSELKKD